MVFIIKMGTPPIQEPPEEEKIPDIKENELPE